MRLKILPLIIILPSLIVSPFLQHEFLSRQTLQDKTQEVFVGVAAAYDNLEEIKKLVDETSSYTNTFVIGSTGITYNVTKLNDACQYIYDRGMYFMIYMHPHHEPEKLNEQRQWVKNARIRWGEQFLGLYAYDEVGGRQIDNAPIRLLDETEIPANYTDAADEYVAQLNDILEHTRESSIQSGNLTLFTSDYALYWFDYKGGYDVVFAEFGWNCSRQLNVGLDRGAATVQNKCWGVMITWTYNHPPYLESGAELYQDMVLAYNNGAKYILVFDTNKDYTQGVLEDEHLDALKKFWQYTKNNSGNSSPIDDRVAFVLPKGYAYGFRGPCDKIWGLWETDSFSYEISANLDKMLEQYRTKLDIIYDDGLELDNACGYSKLVFWNGTVYNP